MVKSAISCENLYKGITLLKQGFAFTFLGCATTPLRYYIPRLTILLI